MKCNRKVFKTSSTVSARQNTDGSWYLSFSKTQLNSLCSSFMKLIDNHSSDDMLLGNISEKLSTLEQGSETVQGELRDLSSTIENSPCPSILLASSNERTFTRRNEVYQCSPVPLTDPIFVLPVLRFLVNSCSVYPLVIVFVDGQFKCAAVEKVSEEIVQVRSSEGNVHSFIPNQLVSRLKTYHILSYYRVNEKDVQSEKFCIADGNKIVGYLYRSGMFSQVISLFAGYYRTHVHNGCSLSVSR